MTQNNHNIFTIKHVKVIAKYTILTLASLLMLLPVIWMVAASFKSNQELFTSVRILPVKPTLDGYTSAFSSYSGNINLLGAMLNTYKYVLPKVAFTIISSVCAAYGFARFDFRHKRLLFGVLIATLFIPQTVLNVPQYLLFANLDWIDSPHFAALIIPSLLAADTYFIFMLIQFFRSVPRELDDAAKIDGCGSLKTLIYVLLPMLRPALFSVGILQFLWSSNDYMQPLLYVNTPKNYPISVYLKLAMDADSGFEWNRILAASTISILPSIIIFLIGQKQFTAGIYSGAIKE